MAMSTNHSKWNGAIIDAHVHFYDCFKLSDTLDAAYGNVRREACRQNKTVDYLGVLFLTETAKHNRFRQLQELAAKEMDHHNCHIGAWRFTELSADDCSLLANRNDGGELLLVAGRQILTSERLEILALGTEHRFDDGAPLTEALNFITEINAIPVLPWGVGKWLGQRGKVVEQILSSNGIKDLFLGDISGRPFFWPRPSIFRLAGSIGVNVLPGTDPLPLASEATRPGRYGFTVEGPISRIKPAHEIKCLLRKPCTRIKPYGKQENMYRFLRNQLLIRLRRK